MHNIKIVLNEIEQTQNLNRDKMLTLTQNLQDILLFKKPMKNY